MSESVEQYVSRVCGYVGDNDPLEVITKTPRRLSETIGALTDAVLDYRAEPGKWNIRQQLAHLVDAELVMSTRMRWAVAEPGKIVKSFDQDAWATSGKYGVLPVDVSLATFVAVRRWTVEWLRRLPISDRDGWIQHEERGKETLVHLVRMMAGHDLNHLRQIRRLLDAAAGRVPLRAIDVNGTPLRAAPPDSARAERRRSEL